MQTQFKWAMVLLLSCRAIAQSQQPPDPAPIEEESHPQLITIGVWYLTLADNASSTPAALDATRDPHRPGGSIGLRGQFLEELARWEAQGQIERSYYMQLTAIEGETLSTMVREHTPQVKGISISQQGESRSISKQDTGLILEATPRFVAGDTLIVRVEFEESLSVASDVALFVPPDQREPVVANVETAFRVESTVRARLGHAMLVGRTQGSRNKHQAGHVVVLCAKTDND